MKRYALLSVFDKTGIEGFAKGLVDLGYSLLSTGGTYSALKKAGIAVQEVSEITQFPEILDGRVKTLTPQVHAGILARRDHPTDMDTLQELEIDTIDVVAVNLYPFFEKMGDPALGFSEKVEFIDIGGPTMLRSAAKNFPHVAVVCDPDDYSFVLEGLGKGELSYEKRQALAAKVFNLTSAYDAAVFRFLSKETFPEYYTVSYQKKQNLRYGENPHQKAAFYVNTVDPGALGSFKQLSGKELSYNNLRDLEIAWRLVSEFAEGKPFCCALKHNTPCGAAVGETLLQAYEKAYACDPTSIFGGIVGLNQTVDAATAEKMNEIFLEIVAAPDFTPEALDILRKKKNLRVLKMERMSSPGVTFSKVHGGLLVQEEDQLLLSGLTVVTKADFVDTFEPDILFGLKVIKYVKSNAILVVENGATLGIGGGQVNRIWPTKDALSRAAEGKGSRDLSGATLVSDAFFPFEDCVREAHQYNIKMIAQPGGSQNDQRSIEECDANGICMAMTGIRHFMH